MNNQQKQQLINVIRAYIFAYKATGNIGYRIGAVKAYKQLKMETRRFKLVA